MNIYIATIGPIEKISGRFEKKVGREIIDFHHFVTFGQPVKKQLHFLVHYTTEIQMHILNHPLVQSTCCRYLKVSSDFTRTNGNTLEVKKHEPKSIEARKTIFSLI